MFSLSSSFSIFNDVVVLENSESGIVFGTLSEIEPELKSRLEKSVENFFKRQNKNGTCAFKVVSEEAFSRALMKQYGESDESKSLSEKEFERGGERQDESSASILLLDSILNDAVKLGATDIHIEETEIRFRVGGILKKALSISLERNVELVRRIKVLSKLNLMENRRGQDGQFSFVCSEKNVVFVRVSIVPSVSSGGKDFSLESVVLRLLDSKRVPLDLERLGFSASQREQMDALIHRENGLILVCGPTGSGKSTTAASLLLGLRSEDGFSKKIITIEDPVEYLLDGITQLRVNERLGMSFEESLRLIFRQDPDVIFVGEIRDGKTARTVVQASLT